MRSNSSTVYPAFASISPTVDFAVSNSKVLLPMVMYTGKTYSIFTEVVYPVLSMLMSVIDCKVKKIDVSADFVHSSPSFSVSFAVKAKPIQLIIAVLTGLWEYKKYKGVNFNE